MSTSLLDRTECPGCGDPDAVTVVRCSYEEPRLQKFLMAYYGLSAEALRPLSGVDYRLLRCNRCRLVYQRLAPIGELAESIYGTWIEPSVGRTDQLSRYDVASHARLAEEIGSAINDLGLPPREVTVLDVGMGWGEWCLVARAYGCRVYGLELAEDCITHAHETGVDTVGWAEIGCDRFDFINAAQVLEHLPQPAAALRTLRDALKPGGLLHVAVPDGSRVDRVLRGLNWDLRGLKDRRFMLVHPLEHVNCFCPLSLNTAAARAGLRPARPVLRNNTVVIEAIRLRPLLTALARPLYRQLRPNPPDHWYRKDGRR